MNNLNDLINALSKGQCIILGFLSGCFLDIMSFFVACHFDKKYKNNPEELPDQPGTRPG